MRSDWARLLRRTAHAAGYLLFHTILAAIFIALISILQRFLAWEGEPLLFDIFPIRYIFDAMDCSIGFVFIYFGTRDAIRVFGRDEDA